MHNVSSIERNNCTIRHAYDKLTVTSEIHCVSFESTLSGRHFHLFPESPAQSLDLFQQLVFVSRFEISIRAIDLFDDLPSKHGPVDLSAEFMTKRGRSLSKCSWKARDVDVHVQTKAEDQMI